MDISTFSGKPRHQGRKGPTHARPATADPAACGWLTSAALDREGLLRPFGLDDLQYGLYPLQQVDVHKGRLSLPHDADRNAHGKLLPHIWVSQLAARAHPPEIHA